MMNAQELDNLASELEALALQCQVVGVQMRNSAQATLTPLATITQGGRLEALRDELRETMVKLEHSRRMNVEAEKLIGEMRAEREALVQKTMQQADTIAELQERQRQVMCAQDTLRMNLLEDMIQQGVVSSCFEMDGGIHLTLERPHNPNAQPDQVSIRNANTLRDALDQVVNNKGLWTRVVEESAKDSVLRQVPLIEPILQPDFQHIDGKRMSELTPEQQDDARELWLRKSAGWWGGADKDSNHIQFLLDRLERARIKPVTTEYARGVMAAAHLLGKMADIFAEEHGYADNGGLAFGSGVGGEIKMDHYNTLKELEEAVVKLLEQPRDVPHIQQKALVLRMGIALEAQLAARDAKYPGNPWQNESNVPWMYAKLQKHITNGNWLDAIAYLAFLWHHSAQPEPEAERFVNVARVVSPEYAGAPQEVADWLNGQHSTDLVLWLFNPMPEGSPLYQDVGA